MDQTRLAGEQSMKALGTFFGHITLVTLLTMFLAFVTACGNNDTDQQAHTNQPVRSQVPKQPELPVLENPNPEAPGQVTEPANPAENPSNNELTDQYPSVPAEEEEEETQPPFNLQNQEQLPATLTEEEITTLETQYTSAGKDDLRAQLSELMNKKMKLGSDKVRYYITAKSIRSMRAEIHGEQMIVQVEHSSQTGPAMTALKGTLDAQSGLAKLRKFEMQNSNAAQISKVVKKANSEAPKANSGAPKANSGAPKANSDSQKANSEAQETQKAQGLNETGTSMSGSALCLDRDATKCLVVLVQLKVGGLKTPVLALVRRTASHVTLLKQNPSSAQSSQFLNYFTADPNQTEASLKGVELTSSEVIHGRSEIKMVMLMNNQQMILANGPLRAPMTSNLTNIAWKLQKDLKDLKGKNPRSGYQQDLQQQIAGVRMLTNNGKGNFTLGFKFGLENSKPASNEISLEFSRLQPALKNLEEIRRDLKKQGAVIEF
jgi:hypothetical protein